MVLKEKKEPQIEFWMRSCELANKPQRYNTKTKFLSRKLSSVYCFLGFFYTNEYLNNGEFRFATEK